MSGAQQRAWCVCFSDSLRSIFYQLIVIDSIAFCIAPRCLCAFCRRLLKWLVTRKNGHIMKNCSVAGIRSFYCRLGLSLNLRGGECMLSEARLLHCDLWCCCPPWRMIWAALIHVLMLMWFPFDFEISSLHSSLDCWRTKGLFYAVA